jgi:uncharacterized protein YoxC
MNITIEKLYLLVRPTDLREVTASLRAIEQKLTAVSTKETEIMATAQEMLDAVRQEGTVVDGVVAAIKALRDQIAGMGNVPADVQDAINATIAQITGDKAKLADALAENTPVDTGDLTGNAGGTTTPADASGPT